MPRTNADWLSDLRSTGSLREAALADLRARILSALPRALSPWLSSADPRFEPLAEETAQETLLRVLSHLDTFEGRSQFTTWVYKIAVRVALSELRRQKWRDVSLDDLLEEKDDQPAQTRLEIDPAVGPETAAERADLLERVRRIIAEGLTDRQRTALVATGVRGMPPDEVARRMGMQPNALYKLIHDARLRLKRRLEREGLTPAEILTLFEK
ncbi:MAG TPA: sigma-70 family RNA polymerase sigma factor [Anaerolineaceae bacterium]